MKAWYTILMKLKNKFLLIILILFCGNTYAQESFYKDAKRLFKQNEFEKAKFLFQKNLVFNPKDSNSYLYLAKIYEIEDNEKETEKNLNSTLLIDPSNEEAMYMKMDIELNRSNFSKVKEIKSNFEKICSKMCDKITSIQERLKNFDSTNES